ncbi:MAG: class I SAM-dependent methyltransferase [Eubacteriales bacterium]|nr:class I SAM-dependent methyltransferase [Eubacteriales bacterium]
MRQKVGGVVLDDTWYPGEDLYSDGSVENELLNIVKSNPPEDYNRIIDKKSSWPVLYHLSHQRGNVLEWLPIQKNERVLEVGSGCGAITGTLAAKAKSVTCIELSKRRSMINAVRNQKAENVEILLGNFQTVEKQLTQKYEWITLIGVLEYGELYIDSPDPHVDFLKTIKQHLTPGGRIVIAIENRLGLKYFAGCTEDHTGNYFEGIEGYAAEKRGIRTFSRPELESICRKAELSELEFYYPYPDYKLPTTIYSDRYLPKAGELRDNMRNFDRERYLLFDEARTYDSLIRDGLFPIFSNSFLVIASADAAEQELIYSKYSNERDEHTAIRTDIVEKQGRRSVRKAACGEKGREHVAKIADWYERLNALYEHTPLQMNRVKRTEDGIEAEYLTGHTLEEELDQKLARNDIAGVTEQLMDYIEIVRSTGSSEAFTVTPEFTKVFGKAKLPEGLRSASVTDIDLVAGNAVRTADGWTLIDYEWTFDFPIPVNYVIYRIIYFYVYGNSSRAALYSENLYQKAGLSEEEVQEYWEMEEHFQQYVLGDLVPMRLLYPKISQGHIDMRAEDARRKQAKEHSPATKQPIVFCIDAMERSPKQLLLEGWAVSLQGKVLEYQVLDAAGKPLKIKEQRRFRRKDVNALYAASGENARSGFQILCELPAAAPHKQKFTFVAKCQGAGVKQSLNETKLQLAATSAGKGLRKLARKGGHQIQYRFLNEELRIKVKEGQDE